MTSLLLAFLFSGWAYGGVINAPKPEIVTFTSGESTFRGYLYKPDGIGPFPVVIWLHGHAKRLIEAGSATEYDGLAKAYTSDNYVLFVPDRHTHGIAEEERSQELDELLRTDPQARKAKSLKYIENLETNTKDVVAAVEWLKKQEYIDLHRVVLSGWSSGGIQALLAAELGLGIRAVIPFSPGITQWDREALPPLLVRATKNIKVPIFVIQGSNDKTLGPKEMLGRELDKRGGLNRSKVYAWNKKSGVQFQSLAIAGWESWGYEVLSWLDEVWKAGSPIEPPSFKEVN